MQLTGGVLSRTYISILGVWCWVKGWKSPDLGVSSQRQPPPSARVICIFRVVELKSAPAHSKPKTMGTINESLSNKSPRTKSGCVPGPHRDPVAGGPSPCTEKGPGSGRLSHQGGTGTGSGALMTETQLE
jgi:hypothetical protein